MHKNYFGSDFRDFVQFLVGNFCGSIWASGRGRSKSPRGFWPRWLWTPKHALENMWKAHVIKVKVRGDFEHFRVWKLPENNLRQNKYAMNTLKSSNNAKHFIYWQKMAGRSKSPRAGLTLNASHILLQEATIMVNNFMNNSRQNKYIYAMNTLNH